MATDSTLASTVPTVWEQIGLASDEPICAFDTSFRLIAFNAAHNAEFSRVNGFETRVGDVFPDLFVEAQRPVMRSLMARALTGEPFTVVEEFGNPEIAAPRWEISYMPLRDAEGNVVGAFHRARDLTDSPIRVRSLVRVADVERDLDDAQFRRVVQALDERLRDVVNPDLIAQLCAEIVGAELGAGGAGFGTMLADGETMTIERDWVAPGAVSVVGTHRLSDFGDYTEVLRRGDDLVVNDVTIDQRTAHRREAYARLGVRSAVNIPILENGRYVAMFFVLGPQPRSWAPAELAFIRNVGERARLHIERRRAESGLRALTSDLEQQVLQRTRERDRLWETSEDLLAHADFAGTIFRMSPSWTRTLGHPEQFLATTSYLDLVHPQDIAGLRQALELLRSSGQPVRHTSRLRHQDGSWRTLDWSMVPEPDDATFNTVGRDVTAERDAENAKASLELQLQQSQKMEAVGQLTGGLAHDFNNLLASVSGNLQVMRKRLARGESDDLERRVDASLESVRRAATLTQRLLAFSRQQTLQATPTDITRLVYGMEALIQGAVGPSVALDVRCSATLWAAEVDRSQLESALLNLCLNARDAMASRHGTLTITTANVSIDPQVAFAEGLRPGEYVLLSVSDTGSGIPEEIRDRVFDPFFTTKPMGEGTGLGLSMVYGFVRQSNGQVRVDSEVGKGTTMGLYFPRFAGPVPADRRVGIEPSGGSASSERILFVEDDENIRSLLGEVLRDEGYAVIEAGDGATAVRALESGARIDLLLTDVGLPGGMNGRQLADAARIARPGMKVLFLTGYAENASAWSGRLDAGMQVMTKPFEIPALLNKLREIVAA